jgi:hypothetical protein
MLEELLSKFRARGASQQALEFAASVVEMPAPPKAKGSPAIPTYLRNAQQPPDSFLIQDDLRLANVDIESLRTHPSTPATLRILSKASPDLSAAKSAFNRVGITSKYTVISRNLDGTLNEQGTQLAQELCRRFDLLGPTEGGYNAWPSIRACSESMGGELYLLGACAMEVVLNKSRLPEALMPIAVDTIKFKYQKRRKVPFQVLGGEEVSLDFPTFFYVSLDQSLRTAYADSQVESCIQPMIASQSFANDLRRVFRRSISPRLKSTLNHEKWLASVPSEIRHDPVELEKYQNRAIAQVESLINGLNPEDALILWDIVEVDLLNNGNTTLSEEYKIFSSILNGKLAAGAKTMPVILGHESVGSSNIASSQAMLYLKQVEGACMFKLNEIYSRALTLCVRLYGIDAVVEFAYDPPNLRPESELEAFKSMRQSRILEQLSLGLITDAEANLELTGTLPPPGAPKLSGTMFKNSPPGNISTPESNTGALEQDLSGDAPKEPKS